MLVVTLAVLAGLVLPGVAWAQATPVTIDDLTPALAEGEGGSSSVSLGFTNLTGESITLTPTASDATDTGCRLTADKSTLPRAEHTDVEVTVPAGCKIGEDGIDFKVTAEVPKAEPFVFEVTAAPKPDTAKPEWDALWAFPVALVAMLVAAIFFFFAWRTQHSPPNQPLQYLEDTWSFSDSWVSNVTVAGGLLTGIFGTSDVVTALVGEEADSSVALATVGAAVAVAFIAAGPLLVLATRSKTGDFFTVGGLLAASAVTLAGAFGQLWVIYRAGEALDLGGWEDKVIILAAAAAVLLAVYAVRSLSATLKQGTTPPPPDEAIPIHVVVDALKAHPEVDEKKLQTAFAERFPTLAAAPAQAAPRRRRSAVL